MLKIRRVTYYNIEVIISLVYRIRSVIVTHLHWWATKRLKKYFLLQRPSVTVRYRSEERTFSIMNLF